MSDDCPPPRRPRAAAPGRGTTRSTSPITTTNGACRNTTTARFRKADARRLPGRPVVDHHPAQARQFPPRLRRLRAGRHRALRQAQDRGADARRRHRAQPRQDRRRGRLSARLSRHHGEGPRLLARSCGISSTASRRSTTSAARGQVPAETPVSRAMSKELARAASSSCGPTIVYAFMQAVGMVNDHLVTATATPRWRSRRTALSRGARTTRVRGCRGDAGAARLAAHAVGPPARPARSLAARHRDRGHRARPRPRGALERPDHRRAHLLGRAAHAAGRGDRAAPASASLDRPAGARDAAARRAGIRDRRHDLAVQGGDRRRLQGGGGAPARRRSICASACRRTLPADVAAS